jgi:hypothetical protein
MSNRHPAYWRFLVTVKVSVEIGARTSQSGQDLSV